MNKFRLFFIVVSITLFGFIVYYNSIAINKLSKVKIFLPEKNNLYNNLFLKDTNLVAKLAFRSSNTELPLQTYIYKNKFDVLVFPIKGLDSNEIKLPISSLVTFFNNTEPRETTTDQIYTGSYKNRNFKFFSLLDSSIVKKKFKVYYEGLSTTESVVKDNLISRSLYTNSFKITTEGLAYILYYIDNIHSLMEPKMSMEITFLKKDKFLYAILTFPKTNEIIKDKSEILNIIKQ